MTKWDGVRSVFALKPWRVHFTAMSLASHPAPVQFEIDRHKTSLNLEPLPHVLSTFGHSEEVTFQAASRYFGVAPELIALTGSTTMGLGQVIGGLKIGNGQEILTSTAEHFTTVDTLTLRRQRDGIKSRTFKLYNRAATATVEEILKNVDAAIGPETRLLSLPWVSSSDGLKIPVQEISRVVRRKNLDRPDPETKLLFSIDGVHGFGVEDTDFGQLGCDIFIAGCHKWVFGPRGTGIICATAEAWSQIVPIVLSFSALTKGPGRIHSPGGVHAYEHTLSVGCAFDFLMEIGKTALNARVRDLIVRLRNGLTAKGMQIETPKSADLSSGIVCFTHPDEKPSQTIGRLDKSGIAVTQSGKDVTGRTYVRVSVAVFNNESDIDQLIAAV